MSPETRTYTEKLSNQTQTYRDTEERTKTASDNKTGANKFWMHCTDSAYQLRTRLFHVKHMCDYEIIIIKETTGDISCSNTDITTNAAWFSSVLLLLLLLLRYLLLHFKVHAELYLVLLRNHLHTMTFQLALLWLSVWDEFKRLLQGHAPHSIVRYLNQSNYLNESNAKQEVQTSHVL